jgi:hypothetical protein
VTTRSLSLWPQGSRAGIQRDYAGAIRRLLSNIGLAASANPRSSNSRTPINSRKRLLPCLEHAGRRH